MNVSVLTSKISTHPKPGDHISCELHFLGDCIIFTFAQHTRNFIAVMIAMKFLWVLLTAGTGVSEGLPEMASDSLGVLMRSQGGLIWRKFRYN